MSGTGWMLIALAYVLLAPVIGCLLSGVDRRLSARMQGRRGPPVMQPYYDVRKFLEKEQISSNHVQDLYVGVYLFFVIVTGILFFSGQDLLLTIFALTLGETFLTLAAYSSGSPFSQIGAQRELYAAMSFEPIFLLTAIGFYLETGSFSVSDIVGSGSVPTVMMAGFLVAFVFGLTMKMRKSPFDLSMSHHAHQDLVRGLTTEFSGRTLAMIEISHWYENIMLLGMVALFFLDGSLLWTGVGMLAAVLVFLLEIVIDNGFARMTWQTALKSGWAVAVLFGLLNVAIVLYLRGVEICHIQRNRLGSSTTMHPAATDATSRFWHASHRCTMWRDSA